MQIAIWRACVGGDFVWPGRRAIECHRPERVVAAGGEEPAHRRIDGGAHVQVPLELVDGVVAAAQKRPIGALVEIGKRGRIAVGAIVVGRKAKARVTVDAGAVYDSGSRSQAIGILAQVATKTVERVASVVLDQRAVVRGLPPLSYQVNWLDW